jgi:hypothetical protein
MAALGAVFYFYAAGSLIADMLEDESASADELFPAGGLTADCPRGDDANVALRGRHWVGGHDPSPRRRNVCVQGG